MSTNVVMPQMGESIAEGTIVRWIKKVGDNVDRDEPLFEISTDKVDAEIPSPGAGVLTEIKVKEGETVPVNAVVAVIGVAVDLPPKGGSHMDRADLPPKGGSHAEQQADGGSRTHDAGEPHASQANGLSEMPEAAVGQPESAAPGSIEELRRQK